MEINMPKKKIEDQNQTNAEKIAYFEIRYTYLENEKKELEQQLSTLKAKIKMLREQLVYNNSSLKRSNSTSNLHPSSDFKTI